MKLYRLHYGEDIKQGIFQGETGTEYDCINIIFSMCYEEEFLQFCRKELHNPKLYEFYIEPSKDAIFYFKETTFNSIDYMIKDFIETAERMSISVNIAEIELDELNTYKCYYQDENQMCLEY